MKIPLTVFVVFAAISMVFLPNEARANPNGSNQPQQKAAQRPAPRGVPTNMGNFWDSKQWDREGGSSFWHATEESGGQPVQPTPQPQPKGKKNSGLLKKIFKD